MLARTHVAFGLLCGVYLLEYISPAIGKMESILFYALVVFASLLPDIDSHNSVISRKLWPLSKLVHILAKHRGIFHSIFLNAYLGAVVFFFNPLYGMAIFIGYASHLLIDATTLEGIDFLYPISRFKIAGPIRTGGFAEKIVFFVILGLILVKIF